MLWIIAILFVACVSTKDDRVEVTDPACNLAPVKEKIQSWVDSGYYSGASLIVVKDDHVILEKYFGNYNRSTQVYIASAGKWLAAAAIAAVVDEGKLSWDDRVVQWLPEFNDVKGEATLRQLLSHTSGYPDYQPEGRPRDDYQSLQGSVAHIIDLSAYTPPGAAFRYGGLSMQVAGRMAELASGKDWETLFQEKIAVPLQMHDTHFIPVDTADGHSPMLGGGARTLLHDYAHFLEMIAHGGVYKGKRVLSENVIYEMQADQVKNAVVFPGEYVENARASKHTGIYGLGEWREMVNKYGDAVLISSPGWAGAYPWIDKDNNVYGFFLAHVNVAKANIDRFSSFYASPVLPLMVREGLPKHKIGEVNKNFKDPARSERCPVQPETYFCSL